MAFMAVLTLTLSFGLFVSESLADEMATNGNFASSCSSWSLTATCDGGTTHTADGSGSVTVSASGRNDSISGTAIQTVSIPANSTVDAVSIWTYFNETLVSCTSNCDSVTIDLRYLDTTTVNILDSGELDTMDTWLQQTSSPAVTLTQDVDQIIITVNTKTANDRNATSDLWADDLSITYSPPGSPDSLSFVSNTTIATSPVIEGTQDVQMQRIAVTCTAGGANNNNCLIDSIDIIDMGADNTGVIANLEVHLDTDTTFPGNENVQDPSYTGGSTNISLSTLSAGLRTVPDAGTLYIWIVYDLNGGTSGKDVTSRVTAVNVEASAGDTGASGTWDSNNLSISTASGPESLTVNTNNPVASAASQGVSDVQMQWILVDCNDNGGGGDGFCNIDTVTVDDTQTSLTGTIDTLEVHFDDDTNFGNGTLSSTSELNWDGQEVSVSMSGKSGSNMAINTSVYIWILYDINASAPLNDIQSSVTAITLDTGVEADVSPSGGPWNSTQFAITAPVPDSLSVSGNLAVASTATGGEQNVQMEWLQVDCSAGGGDDGICNISSVTVNDLVVNTGGTIDTLEVHMDDDSDFGNGTLGSNSVSGWDGEVGTGVVDMSLVSGNDVTAGISKYIWIVYDLNAAASGNIQSSVTAMAVSGPDNPPTGGPWNSDIITVIEANIPPEDPGGLGQFKMDGSTPISAGGTTTEKTVLIKATVTDTNSTPDTVRLEVEMTDGAFTGTPTCVSSYVSSGNDAIATCTYLDSGSQHNWKARTYDGQDFNASGWFESMAGNPDVIISNTAPELPNYNADLNQYHMDGSTQISQDGLTGETTAKISATLSDADQDNIKLEVEIIDYNGGASSFGDTPNCSSGFVADGSVATATCKNLVDAVEYMWQARTNDGTTTSSWQGFGTATDLTVAISGASNKLIHSSNNLNSPKWAAQGGWGIDGKCDDPTYVTQFECELNSGTWTPGGKYGQFVCDTCHTSDTTNIKRIKTNITAPNGIDEFPGETGGLGIVLTDQRDGTADFGDDNDPTGHPNSTKICEYCHSENKYHNYSTSEPEQVTLLHNNSKDCNVCHQHKNGFAGGGECILCHDGVPLPNSYITRDITGSVSGDFTKSSRHIFGASTVQITNWDCIVCHAEGDAATAVNGEVLMTLKHNNSGAGGQSSNGIVVDLRDVDNPGTSWAWDKYDGTCAGGSGGDDVNECVDGFGTWTWSTDQMLTDMDTFCMKCHDSDASRGADLGGASGIAVNSTNDGVELKGVTNNPLPFDIRMKPFNIDDGVDQGTGGGTKFLPGYERTAVIDAYGQFNPANPSHHAVIGTAYGDHNANWGSGAWTADRRLKNGNWLHDSANPNFPDSRYEAAAMHCADCHTVDYNSHGASNGFMLEADSIDGTCWLCHSNTVYADVSSGLTRWDHSKDTNVWKTSPTKLAKIGDYYGSGATLGSACRNCHGGMIGEGGSFADGYGGIHGLPAGADPRAGGDERYRFIGGDYMAHRPGDTADSWWTTNPNGRSCYFNASSTSVDWSYCSQHSGDLTENKSKDMVPAYSRGVPGQY